MGQGALETLAIPATHTPTIAQQIAIGYTLAMRRERVASAARRGVPKLIRFPEEVYEVLSRMAAADLRNVTNFLVRLVLEEAERRGLLRVEEAEGEAEQ